MPPMRNDPFQRLGLDREVLTVSQLNQRARLLLEDVFPQVWVEGELSNLARPASGHVYFTLKDSNAQIRCALFRQNALRVRQALRDGLAVKVRGKISLFEGRGDYQLIADTVEPAGDGALRLAFEALKEKLAGEGLFASERKRPLPAHPRRIGIVSSPSGAVIRDIISVFRRRAPQVELTLVPTAVQGREAVAQIVRALQLADRQGFDALILARGGGSLEDLWCFNEEAVARAVAACATPIVSAVGHETDVSISDFVADVRAPTPSAAAELLAPNAGDLQQRLDGLRRREQLRALARGRVPFAHLASLLQMTGQFTVYTYIVPFLVGSMALDKPTISLVLLVYGGGGILGALLGGRAADRWPGPATFVAFLLLHALALVLLPFATGGLPLLLGAVVFWCVFNMAPGPAIQKYLVELSPDTAAIQISLNTSAIQLGVALGAFIGAILVDQVAVRALPWWGAALILGAGACGWLSAQRPAAGSADCRERLD